MFCLRCVCIVFLCVNIRKLSFCLFVRSLCICFGCFVRLLICSCFRSLARVFNCLLGGRFYVFLSLLWCSCACGLQLCRFVGLHARRLVFVW